MNKLVSSTVLYYSTMFNHFFWNKSVFEILYIHNKSNSILLQNINFYLYSLNERFVLQKKSEKRLAFYRSITIKVLFLGCINRNYNLKGIRSYFQKINTLVPTQSSV